MLCSACLPSILRRDLRKATPLSLKNSRPCRDRRRLLRGETGDLRQVVGHVDEAIARGARDPRPCPHTGYGPPDQTTRLHADMSHTWCTHPPRTRPKRHNVNRLDTLASTTTYVRMQSKTQSTQWQQTRVPLRTRRSRGANMVAHMERCNLSARKGPAHAEQPFAARWHQTFLLSRTRCAHGAQMVAHAERCNLSANATLQPVHTHADAYVMALCVCVDVCVCVCVLRRAEDSAHVW